MSFTMYDSVDVREIPHDAKAVAGYVGGHWPTFRTLQRLFPHAHKLSIAVNARQDAQCLDVERGDATPAEAPAWVRRQQKRGLRRPVIYCSVSEAPAVLRALKRAGIKRRQIRLWTAHYTFKPHLCTKECGFGDVRADATQFTDRAKGRNLDASIVRDGFFRAPLLERIRNRFGSRRASDL